VAKHKRSQRRARDRAEEILDYLYDDRNREIRAACKTIIRGATRGLAIYADIQQIDQAARKGGSKILPHPTYLNLQGLLWMLELEIACLLDDYIRSRDERRWLYARLLLLSLFESTRTLRGVFSREYRKDIELRLGAQNSERISELHGYIHHAFNDLNADYGEIRNRLLGHRDPDAALRWQLLSSINGQEIKEFAWEVIEWCAAMAMLHQDYMAEIQRLNGDN
jgi:hypothetical protein